MKLRKILTAICSVAVIASAISFTTVSAADADYKISLEFAGYSTAGTTTFANVNVNLEIPETLSAYTEIEPDWENTFDYEYSGVTIQGAGIDIPYVDGLQFIKAKSTADSWLTITANATDSKAQLSYAATGAFDTYYAGETNKTIATLSYRITGDVSAAYDLAISSAKIGFATWSGTNATPSVYEKVLTTTGCTVKPEEATKYAVTVVGGTADVAEAEEGATVTVTPVIPEGKQIASVTGAEVTAQADGTYTFTMPAEAVTITITYEDIPAPVFGYEVEKEATLYIDKDETKPVYQFDCVVENYAENNVTIKFACENATMTRLLENLPTIQGGAGLSFTALVANAPAAVTLTSIAD